MYHHIFLTMMSITVEAVANVLAHILSTYHREVSSESVHQCTPSLSHILFPTFLTRDAVNQINALAGDILLTFISLLGVMTSYHTSVVDLRAILTISCLALIDGLTA